MMQSEFEELTGVCVDTEVYHTIIEPMYNAIPDWMTKQQFTAMLNPDYICDMLPQHKINDIKNAARVLLDIGIRDIDLECLDAYTFGSEKWKTMYHLKRLMRCLE